METPEPTKLRKALAITGGIFTFFACFFLLISILKLYKIDWIIFPDELSEIRGDPFLFLWLIFFFGAIAGFVYKVICAPSFLEFSIKYAIGDMTGGRVSASKKDLREAASTFLFVASLALLILIGLFFAPLIFLISPYFVILSWALQFMVIGAAAKSLKSNLSAIDQ